MSRLSLVVLLLCLFLAFVSSSSSSLHHSILTDSPVEDSTVFSPSSLSSASPSVKYPLPPHLRPASPRSRSSADELSADEAALPTSVDSFALSFAQSNGTGHSFHSLQATEDYFSMTRLSGSAPWSTRIQPALLLMYKPTSYTQHATGLGVSTGSPWLILFEGTLTMTSGGGGLYNENDVWASADGGRTWDLMAGISRDGRSGVVQSASANSSFSGRQGADNCEDPDSDYIFSIGGLDNAVGLATNQVWYSSNGKDWRRQDSRGDLHSSRASSPPATSTAPATSSPLGESTPTRTLLGESFSTTSGPPPSSRASVSGAA